MEKGIHNWIDILIFSIFCTLTVAVAVWSLCQKYRDTAKGYFLAGRAMWWLPIGFSLFGSNIGIEQIVGLAGEAASSGIAPVVFQWSAVLHLLLLGWVFLPVYMLFGVYTVPEFLQRRFGGTRLKLYFSCVSICVYLVCKISVSVYAGAMFIQQALGWNMHLSIVSILVITSTFTVIGGLPAVIFTDTLQTVTILTGAVTLTVIGLKRVGGVKELEYKYSMSMSSTYNVTDNYPYTNNVTLNNTCGLPREDFNHIFRDPMDADYPWPSLALQSVFGSLWFFCADQLMVQRALSAKNIAQARGGTIIAGYLQLLSLFIMVVPGMVSRILYPDEVACIHPVVCLAVCDNEAGCSSIAYPRLILGLAPTGLRGLMVAVMMAAMVSSLTSVFNSAATVFALDIWKTFRKRASENELITTARLFVVFLTVAGMACIPMVRSDEGPYIYPIMRTLSVYVAPPIVSCFMLTMFLPWTTEQGAFWSMLIGHAGGLARLILDCIYPAPRCGEEDSRPYLVVSVNTTYVSGILLVVTICLSILISLCTRKKGESTILHYWTVHRCIVIGKDLPFGCAILEHLKKPGTKNRGYDDDIVESGEVTSRSGKITKSATIEDRLRGMRLQLGWSIFLNINAAILMCVFVFLVMLFM